MAKYLDLYCFLGGTYTHPKEGWCPDFAKAAYACWFLENRDPGNVDNCCRCLRDWEWTPRPS
jgi:hypothetical protein